MTVVLVFALFFILTLSQSQHELTEYNCPGVSTVNSGGSRAPQVSVVVCWREGAMLSARTLRELLEHDTDTLFEVIYVHVDLALWRPVLSAACDLQTEFGRRKLRIVKTQEHVFPEKFLLYQRGAAFAQSRFVVFSDNNSLGFDDKEIAQMLAAIKSTHPTPAMLTNEVMSYANGTFVNHFHAKLVYRYSSPFGMEVLRWTEFEGRRDNLTNSLHTVYTNDGGFDIRSSDLVEPHTFIVDTHATNLSIMFAPATSRVDVMLGINAWRAANRQPAIVNNITTHYLYPEVDLQLLDVPLVIARWAIYECTASVRFLEKRWDALYAHQCGAQWHMGKALDSQRFTRERWPELENRATGVIVSAMWFFVVQATHMDLRVSWRDGRETTIANRTATETLMSLSALAQDIDSGNIVAIDALAAQLHTAEPVLAPELAADADWLRQRLQFRVVPRLRRIFTFENANHCMFRPVLMQLTLKSRRALDPALSGAVSNILETAFIIQSDTGGERRAFFVVRGSTMAAIEQTVERLDRRLSDAGIGRLQRVRVKLQAPVYGKWTTLNNSLAVPPAIDAKDPIPLLRASSKVDSVGVGPLPKPTVFYHDFIEEWQIKIAIDEQLMRVAQ
jgi:hypothetical protein